MAGRLFVRPTNGLCNRLGVVTSFAVLARRAHRELAICWAAGPGWSDERLEDLFEHGFRLIGVPQFVVESARGISLHEQVRVTGTGGLDEEWTYAGGSGLEAVFSPAQPVITYRGFRPAHAMLAPEDRRRLLPGFQREWHGELRSLRPVAEIRDRVAAIAQGFDAATVGVHIRRGDAIVHPRVGAQYRRSSDEAFITRMEQLVRRRPATRFFLATDCAETQARFQARFGPRLLVNSEKHFVPSELGAAKDNQRDAVVDLFALARTRTILGSYYSTFSQVAAVIGDARLRIVVGDPWTNRTRRAASLVRHEVVRRARSRSRRLRLR